MHKVVSGRHFVILKLLANLFSLLSSRLLLSGRLFRLLDIRGSLLLMFRGFMKRLLVLLSNIHMDRRLVTPVTTEVTVVALFAPFTVSGGGVVTVVGSRVVTVVSSGVVTVVASGVVTLVASGIVTVVTLDAPVAVAGVVPMGLTGPVVLVVPIATVVSLAVALVVGHSLEVRDVMLGIMLMVGESLLDEGNIMMFNTMSGPVFHLVEKLVVLMLDLTHKLMAIMEVSIVRVVLSVLIMGLVGSLAVAKISAVIITVVTLNIPVIAMVSSCIFTVVGSGEVTLVALEVAMAALKIPGIMAFNVIVTVVALSSLMTIAIVTVVSSSVIAVVAFNIPVISVVSGCILTVMSSGVVTLVSLTSPVTLIAAVVRFTVALMVGNSLKVRDVVLRISLVISQSLLDEGHIVVLNTVLGVVFHLVEKLVVLMLNLTHKGMAIMEVSIMSVVLTVLVMRLTVMLIQIIVAHDGVVLSDVAMAVFDTVAGAVTGLPLTTVVSRGSVMSAFVVSRGSVMGAIVVGRIGTTVGLVRVLSMRLVAVLVGSHLIAEVIASSEVSLSTLGGAALRQIVHLLVEEGSIVTHVCLSFCFSSGRFIVVICRVVLVARVYMSGLLVAMLTVHLATEVISVSGVGTRAIPVHGRSIARIAVLHVALTTESVTLAAHVAVVLLSTDIVVLIGLLGLLALSNAVSWGRLRHDGLDLSGLEPMGTVDILEMIGLHLEDEAAILDKSLGSAESRRVGIKGGVVTLVPAVGIECVEGVTPVEIEALGVRVVSVSLDVVVLNFPRHVLGVEAFAPRLERGSPEVHHDTLRLIRQLDRRIILSDATHLLVVDRPGNEVGGPRHLVDVPIVLGIEAGLVVVSLALGLAITVDHIHGEWVLRYRGHDFDVKLVPATGVEVRSVPVGKEGSDCALLVR